MGISKITDLLEKINKTKIWLFEEFNKIDKLLRLISEKREDTNGQYEESLRIL